MSGRHKGHKRQRRHTTEDVPREQKSSLRESLSGSHNRGERYQSPSPSSSKSVSSTCSRKIPGLENVLQLEPDPEPNISRRSSFYHLSPENARKGGHERSQKSLEDGGGRTRVRRRARSANPPQQKRKVVSRTQKNAHKERRPVVGDRCQQAQEADAGARQLEPDPEIHIFNPAATEIKETSLRLSFETDRQRKISIGKRGTAVLKNLLPEIIRSRHISGVKSAPVSPGSETEGRSFQVVNTYSGTKTKRSPAPSPVKAPATLTGGKNSESQAVLSKENSRHTVQPDIPKHYHQSSSDGKPLARLAIANCMLEKEIQEQEERSVQRSASDCTGKGQQTMGRRSLRPICHSASDTSCNVGRAPKKVKGQTKRRSMSDYLDIKTQNSQSVDAGVLHPNKTTLKSIQSDRNTLPSALPAILTVNKEDEKLLDNTFTAVGEKEKNTVLNTGAQILKNRMTLLRGKMPNPQQQGGKSNNRISPDHMESTLTKQSQVGIQSTSGMEKSETVVNPPFGVQENVKTRKISAEVFRSAFSKKVSTLSNLQSWKRGSNIADKDNQSDSGKGIMQFSQPGIEVHSSVTATPSPVSSSGSTPSREEPKGGHLEAERKLGTTRLTLSVHKLTPIPSVESEDSNADNHLNPEIVLNSGISLPDEEVAIETDITASVIKGKSDNGALNESWQVLPQNLQHGKGILKKISNVDLPLLDDLEVFRQDNINPNNNEMGSPTNNTEGGGESAKKEGLTARFVKFDMPSFDSTNSDEIPEIIIESDINIEDTHFSDSCTIISDTETRIELDDNGLTEEEHVSKENSEISISDQMNKLSLDSKMAVTMQDIFSLINIIKGTKPKEKNTDQLNIEEETEKLLSLRRKHLAKLKHILKDILGINEAMLEKGISPDIKTEDITNDSEGDEDSENEDISVQTHSLVLRNFNASGLCRSCGKSESEQKNASIAQNLKLFDNLSPLGQGPLEIPASRRCLSCPSLPLRTQTTSLLCSSNVKNDHLFAQTFSFKYQDCGDENNIMDTLAPDPTFCSRLDSSPQTDILGQEADSGWSGGGMSEEGASQGTRASSPGSSLGLDMDNVLIDLDLLNQCLAPSCRETCIVDNDIIL